MEQTCTVCEEEKEDCHEHTFGGFLVCPGCRTALYVERSVFEFIIGIARAKYAAENP